MNLAEEIELYLASLDPLQKKAYEIAKQHLTESYTLEKSNGFLNFKKKLDASRMAASKN